jgi:hypothetical protein
MPRQVPLPSRSGQALLARSDDRTDRQSGLLLYALHRTGSQGRGVLWVIRDS